jgi:hypothetical protein
VSRLYTQIDGQKVAISEHGYFDVNGELVDFETLPGIEWFDFNGFGGTTAGRIIQWDSRALRERIRRFLRNR